MCTSRYIPLASTRLCSFFIDERVTGCTDGANGGIRARDRLTIYDRKYNLSDKDTGKAYN